MHEIHKHHDCKHGSPAALSGEHDGGITTDPVCGMKVDSHTSPHQFELDRRPYWFCSASCLGKFQADPQRYLSAPTSEARTAGLSDVPAGTIWTCPMHLQIRQNGPGTCPICGMALEPLEPTLEEGPNPELIDMTRRFWVSAASCL